MTVTDPIHRTILTASQLTEITNEERIRGWVFALVLSGKEDFADTFARGRTSDGERFQAYVIIANALMKTGKTDKAKEALQNARLAAMEIRPSDARLSALGKLAAVKGEIEEALSNTDQMTDPESRTYAISGICRSLIEVGNFDAAIRVARDKVSPWVRPRFLLRIADKLLGAGQTDRGGGIAREAFVLALGLPDGGSSVLQSFAPVLVKAELTDELLQALRGLQKRGIYIGDDSFETIALGFAKSGDIDKALVVARSITSATDEERARALATVSQVLRDAGRKDYADKILREAFDTALSIKLPAHRSGALHKIAPLMVKAGSADEALRAVRADGVIDNEPLAFVAVSLAEIGKLDEARQAAIEAFTGASKFEQTIIRSGAFIRLVKALLKAGKSDEARVFVNIAHQKLAGVKNSMDQSEACKLVAEAHILLGEWSQAAATAELCEQQNDSLAAYTAIVREHSIADHPSLSEIFRKADE